MLTWRQVAKHDLQIAKVFLATAHPVGLGGSLLPAPERIMLQIKLFVLHAPTQRQQILVCLIAKRTHTHIHAVKG